MNERVLRALVLTVGIGLTLAQVSVAQQNAGPIRGNSGQASQPSGSGVPASTNAPAPTSGTVSGAHSTAAAASPATTQQADTGSAADSEPRTVINTNSSDPNANDPLLEPPALPKTKPTLIGGTASRVDHIRNRLTIQPFGGGPKVKVFVDERSHIYRNGEETTVLGIHKGDRVSVDTMLDGARVFARNVRVETQPGIAEVRGQVTAVNPEKGTVTVRDGLTSQAVTLGIGSGTKYSASRGSASSGDLQPGSMVDVQFARGKDKRDVAQEVILLAKPGDTYVFSGVVTNIDLRNNTLALENRSDDETYELHFDQSAVDDKSKLKVGSEVTAHAVFNGKQYNANDLQLRANAENPDKSDKADKSKEQ